MPILQYLFGVGGALLCLMLALNAYVPKAPPREQRDLDKSTIRITARPSGDFVIDHFPAVRVDFAAASTDAVRQALAMVPPDEAKQAGSAVARSNPVPSSVPRKRHLAQRPQAHFATGDAPSPTRPQTLSNRFWSNNGWSQGWPNSASANWTSNWSQNWGNNRWADSR